MTALGLFIACILIYNHEMSGAWYFVAMVIALIDIAMGIDICARGLQHAIGRFPGIRGTVDGGKPRG